MTNFRDLINRPKSEVLGIHEHNEAAYSSLKILNLFKNEKKKILLVGEVQSGKTRTIIDLIKTSLDKENFSLRLDIIIVFGGTNWDLNDQTEKRIKDVDTGLGNYNNVRFKSFTQIYSESEDADKTIIYIGPKIDKLLESINATISNIPNLKEKKVLIIDDETDYGSINTKALDSPSKYPIVMNNLYRLISNKGSALIGVTATPYANLLNKKSYPYSNIFSLPCRKKDGYTGVSYFNSLEGFYIDIDNTELWIHIDSDMRTDEWKRIYLSFCVYIINSLIKLNSDIKDKGKSDFLINTAYETSRHEKIRKNLSIIINDCMNGLPSFIRKLQQLAVDLNKKLDIKIADVEHVLQGIKLTVRNSKNESSYCSDYNIYIGGVLLSRGITYEYLTVEYITNFPEKNVSADTLLQMCRWLGYRSNLDKVSYMNVITTNKGIMSMKEIERYNDLFFGKTEYNGGEQIVSNILNNLNELEKSCVYVKGCGEIKR